MADGFNYYCIDNTRNTYCLGGGFSMDQKF